MGILSWRIHAVYIYITEVQYFVCGNNGKHNELGADGLGINYIPKFVWILLEPFSVSVYSMFYVQLIYYISLDVINRDVWMLMF